MIGFRAQGLHRRAGRVDKTPLSVADRPRHCSGVPSEGRQSACFHAHHDETRCRCGQAVIRPGVVPEVVVAGVAHAFHECTRRQGEQSDLGRVLGRGLAAVRRDPWTVPGVTR